jgi:hypothetical protein
VVSLWLQKLALLNNGEDIFLGATAEYLQGLCWLRRSWASRNATPSIYIGRWFLLLVSFDRYIVPRVT